MRLVLAKLQQYTESFTADEQDLLRKAAPINGQDFTFDNEGKFEQWHINFTYDIDLLPILWLADLVIERPIVSAALENLVHREQTVINQKVNVAVPGFGLLAMTRAMLAQDCCTNALNDYLQDGWRILAICPQPDQRRPDYVLGKAEATEFGKM